MSDIIVDTNVAMIANRQNADVVENCVEACIAFLIRARSTHVVLMDDGDEIRAEYTKALKTSPPHGLGAQFLFHIYQHQGNPNRVRHVHLPKRSDGEFVDFPASPELASFDRDDRKFAALAKATGTPVTNATDSDWANFLQALNANGIEVDFLCGCDKSKWFK